MFTFDFAQKTTVTHFGKNKQLTKWEHSERCLDVNLIVFAVSGQACFEFAGGKYTLSENECLIIPKGNLYKADTSDSFEYFFFHFTGNIIQSAYRYAEPITVDNYLKIPMFAFSLPETEFIQSFSNFKINYSNKVLTVIRECEKLHFEMNQKNRLLIDLKFQEILLELTNPGEKRKKTKLISEVLDFIHERFTEKISLASISTHFYVSKSYIARIFKKHMNVTVVEYILFLKLDYSASLLINSSMTIAQIAEYLNFYDEFYFSKQFKKRFGMSPRTYCEKMKK